LRTLRVIPIFRRWVQNQWLINGVVYDNWLISGWSLSAFDGHRPLSLLLLILFLVTLALEVISILAVEFCFFINWCGLMRGIWLLRFLILLLIRILHGHISCVDIFLQKLLLAWRLIKKSMICMTGRQDLYADSLMWRSLIITAIICCRFWSPCVHRISNWYICVIVLFLALYLLGFYFQ
jgi:hypothetical protein